MRPRWNQRPRAREMVKDKTKKRKGSTLFYVVFIGIAFCIAILTLQLLTSTLSCSPFREEQLAILQFFGQQNLQSSLPSILCPSQPITSIQRQDKEEDRQASTMSDGGSLVLPDLGGASTISDGKSLVAPDLDGSTMSDAYFPVSIHEGCPCPSHDFDPAQLDTMWLSRTNRTKLKFTFKDQPTHLSVLPVPEMDMLRETDPSAPSPGRVVFFKGAFIGGFSVCVFDCNFLYTQGGCSEYKPCELKDTLVSDRKPQLVSKGLLLSQHHSHAIDHGVLECFMRIAFFPPRVLEDPSVSILLNLDKKYMFLLDIFNVNRSRVIAVDEDSFLYAENLAVPSGTQCAYSRRPAVNKVYDTIHARLGSFFPLYPSWRTQRGKVCIVKIAHGTARSIINHDDMVSNLTAAFPSLEVMVYGGHDTTEDMIRKFSSADYFIGPHGVVWVNTLFARRDVKVLEIFPRGWDVAWRDTEKIAIQHLGQGYTEMLADPVAAGSTIMRVKVSEVVASLATMTGLTPRENL